MNLISEDYLMHYGVKGMKWGVRHDPEKKYRSRAEKAYSKGNAKKLKKVLTKQLRNKRAELNGGSNRWIWSGTIGENSKKLFEKDAELEKQYRNSKSYKDWEKKVDRFEKKFEQKPVFDSEAYDRGWKQLHKERPKRNWNKLGGAYVVGKGWSDNYAKKGGLDLSTAYLKDLNYDEKTIKKYTKMLSKNNYVIQ